MKRHRHLHDAHPRPYRSELEREHEMELVHGCQREAGYQLSSSARTSCKRSGGNEDEAGRRCGGDCHRTRKMLSGADNHHEVTAFALSPHVSCSPISFYSAHASALTSGAAETTTATSTAALPLKAFYDGPSLHDSIPTLLARLANAATPSSSRNPASTRSYELGAKRGTSKRDVSSLSPHPIVIPQWSGLQHSDSLGISVSTVRQTKTIKANAPNRSTRPPPDDVPQSTVLPEQILVSRHEVRQPNAKDRTNRRMTSRTKEQAADKEAPPSEATAVAVKTQQRRVGRCTKQYVEMQRPAAAHIPPHASEASAKRDAGMIVSESAPERSVESPTRYRTVASSHSGAEGTSDASSSSSSCFGSRSLRTSPRQSRPSYSDSAANAVSGKQSDLDPEAVVVAATDKCSAEASREAPRTASERLPPPKILSLSSMNSASDPDQKRISPSRMRDIFSFALRNSDRCSSGNSGAGVKRVPPNSARDRTRMSPDSAEGVSSHAANPRQPEQEPSRRIKSPFVLQQPMKGVSASLHSISCPSECVVTVNPFAAAIQEAGDPLVLRHTIDYLLSKARRLERENQRLWWQAHNWDPRRALEPREPHPVASPRAYRRVRSSSLPAATAPRTPTVDPSKRVSPKQIQHLRKPQSRVFVKRQPRLSQATVRSTCWTSTSSVLEVSPRRSSVGVGDATEERSSATPDPHLCTVPVSSPSAAADTSKTQCTKSTLTTATSVVPRAGVGMQCPQDLRAAATDAIEHQPSVDYELVSVAETSQRVSSSHANASAQTEIVTPSAPAPLRTPDARYQAVHHRLRETEGGNGRGISVATPTASTVHFPHSTDSDRSLGGMATHATSLQWFPQLQQRQKQRRSLSSCSSHVQMAGTSHASAFFSSRGRLPTHSKQVQTARISSPSVDEAEDARGGSGGGDTLMGSFMDGSASVPSMERTAVIELHTSTSFTRSTVRRLREYCHSLEVMRQQLRRRLSCSVTNSNTASVTPLSPMQTPSSLSRSHCRLSLTPLATAATTLSRPFFTSEYADPEVDATLHDVDETAAVETMIVLHEDGAGTITKRILDGSHSCISSSAARSSSSQSQRPTASTAPSPTSTYKVAGVGSATSRVHRHSPLCLAGTEAPEVIREEPRMRWYRSSLRSDSHSCCSAPVVHLGKHMQSASASSWGASNPHIRLPDTVPLASSLSSSLPKESPSVTRFAVPPTTPLEEGDMKQLPSHERQTEAAKSVLLHRADQVAPEQASGLQTCVTSSTTRSGRRVNSQRFAVREVSQSMSSKEHSTPRRSKSSCSSASSEALVPAKQAASSTTVAAVAAPPWDPMCHSLRSQRPVVFSIAAAASVAAAPLVSDRFVTPVTTFIGEAGVCGASSDSFHQSHPTATFPHTVAGNASLSPLSAPEPSSEESPPPVITQGQQYIHSPLHHPHLVAHFVRYNHGVSDDQRHLDRDSLNVSEAGSQPLSTPQDPQIDYGDRCKRSNTTVFFDEEERREASEASSAGTCLVGVQIPMMGSDAISPDGADSFHSREAAVSSLSSVERATDFPSSAPLEESLPLHSQRPVPQRLISPSPPRGAAAGDNVQNPFHGSAELTAIPHGSTLQEAGMGSSSPRRHLALPPDLPPVAPLRAIATTKGDASSSVDRSLHSLRSTFSDRAEDDDDGGDSGGGDDAGGGPLYQTSF